MCNAYSLTLPRSALIDLGWEIARQLELELVYGDLPEDFGPRYRYSPRQRAPVFHISNGQLRLRLALWGFLASGGKPGFAPTNARFDKLGTGWPWKMVSEKQRCLVPADGFFEPEKPAGDKSAAPWSFYTLGNRQPFLMAGLINDGPHPKTGEPVPSYAVVTTEANRTIRIHNRMPAIIEDEGISSWLRPGQLPLHLSQPLPGERMTGWRVPNEAKNSRLPDSPRMIERTEQTSLFD